MTQSRPTVQDPFNAFCKDTDAYLQGAAGGPLSGLTFAAKDIFDVAGHVTGGGNPDWKATHQTAIKTAWAVQVLVEAGATMVGKTITDELTRGIFGENPHYGRGPSVEAFLFGQSPGNWAYPASPSESTLRLQVHLSIRTGSSLLTLDHVEPPSVHNNRPVGKWAIPPGLSIYPRAAPLGSSHHHCHPRCHTKLEVGAFSIIELDNYWLDTATTDIIAGPLP